MTSPARLAGSKLDVSVSDTRGGQRRVLVLAGGGAKGAYAFGCMLAFARAKICFRAAAGTSVGALNAILWSTNSLRSGITLWRSISFSSVYPLRFCDPNRYPATLIRVFSAAYVLCRLAWATWGGTPNPGRLLFRALLAFAIWIPCPLLFLYAPDHDSGHVVRDIAVLAFWLWLCWTLLDEGFFNRRILLLPIVVLPYLMMLGTIVGRFTGPFIQTRWLNRLTVYGLLFLVLCFCIAVYMLLRYWFAFDKSVLGSSKLRESISAIISHSQFYMPAVVTIAREQAVFDPDSPRWYTFEKDHTGLPQEGCIWQPETRKTWRAVYIDLTQLPTEKAIQCCLASAAIPFGIVPPVQLGKHTYVDGGVVDNCPVYPFLNRDDIDEIFIVLLSPYRSDQDALRAAGATVEKWQERERQTEVAKFPVPDSFFGGPTNAPSRQRNRPPKVLPYRAPKPLPVCIPFYPSSSLGNFMSGTLNFSGLFAQRSICRGYADARLRLQKLGYWR